MLVKILFATWASLGISSLLHGADSNAQIEHGRDLYFRNCLICHQLNGQGVPGTYPPLAKSDYLMADRERSMRILCEGLNGDIVVNGKKFGGSMPPVVLDDSEVADVMTFVRNSWGNTDDVPLTADEVRRVRARTQIPTYAKLLEAGTYQPLPPAPKGCTLREVVRMTTHGVRMASDGTGRVIYVLIENGDVWRLEPQSGAFRQIIWAKNYLDRKPGDTAGPLFVLGLAFSKDGRLYIASNQPNNLKPPFQNRVTIYRTTAIQDGDPSEPKVWFEKSYPGNSAYVHGMEHIAFGPDGMLYAGNGARTDANQTNPDPNYYQGGELELTSSIWRLDPKSEDPEVEIFARGVRNAYGFCWNHKGEMFATENGPDADAPEELNLIEKGKHYGFPYRFADWTKKAYDHTPEPTAGLEFTLPIANLGPDGGFNGKPIYTFDPHSGPGGIVFLGDDFPAEWRGSFILNRFGNFIRTPKDNVGFDILQARLEKDAKGVFQAHVYSILKPLGRPIDVHHSGHGKLYICEYTRPTNNQGSFALPGRILELSFNADQASN